MSERLAGGVTPKVQKNRQSRGTLVPCMDLIDEHNWQVGHQLMCDARWKGPRTIEAIEGGEVKLRTKGGYTWQASLPADTYQHGRFSDAAPA